MKKVLFISSKYPYPIDNGNKIMLSGFFEYFSNQLNSSHFYWIAPRNTIEQSAVTPSDSVSLIPIEHPNKIYSLFYALFFSLFSGKKSLQEAFLFSMRLKKDIHCKINSINPDVIVFDTIRMAQFGVPESFKGKVIVYYEDLFSLRYSRMLKVLDEDPNVKINALGNFSKNIPFGLGKLIEFNFIQKWLLNREMKLVEKSELFIANEIKNGILLNSDEKNYLLKKNGSIKVSIVKPLLQQTKQQPKFNRAAVKNNNFIFIGSLNLPHNEAGLLAFFKNIMPLMVEAWPDFKLDIVGKYAGQQLLNEVERWPNHVRMHGFVSDLSSMLEECCGMIVPLTFGSGVKLKTLEALSYGVPIVSTSIGVEGIDISNGKNCFVSDDWSEFMTAMLSLQNSEINTAISIGAYDFFYKNYNIDVVFKEYENIFFG